MEQLLDHLKARREAFENVYSVTMWQDFENDRLVRWTKTTVHSDDLGRIRYSEQHGVYGSQGETVPTRKNCQLYNGETTVNFDYNYDVLKGSRKGAGDKIHADIFDGPNPRPLGPASSRNPQTFIDTAVIESLERAISEGRPLVISRIISDESDNLFELHYRDRVTGNNAGLNNRAVIDGDRGWVVVSREGKDAEGGLVYQFEVHFQNTAAGVWVPTDGFYKKLIGGTLKFTSNGKTKEIQLPRTEWRFKCLEFTLNDPQFAEDIFQIRLDPGTYVWDSRYKVDYRVGQEKVIDSNLSALADAAKKKQKRDPSQNPLNQVLQKELEQKAETEFQLGPERPSWHLWLVLGNLVLAAVVAAFYLLRNRRRPA